MQVWLVCSEAQEAELGAMPSNLVVTRKLDMPAHFDTVVDLLFEANRQAHQPVLSALPVPVIVAAPVITGKDLPAGFIRINAWPGFLRGRRVEACGNDETARMAATAVLGMWDKAPEWVPDEPGMIAARVIAGIINEAYLAWSEGIASKEDIDTAMKLGTNYPHGPFEWAELVGRERILHLLETLAVANERYLPCSALKNSVQPGNL
ncbi:3-hydroxybutyryl-CoA dehydrogenase [Cnuella takakiae]|uniref:3-hydroxybutyryl-CoA dehydrogenase n=1 Tax=Cnuella takakiae TaxID=1302690 RepID=A0A1M5IQ58_9BACT|nr:3-hydroxyacyl-CoA dehydrogenase family protein [Cnuella takakiae]OLY93951.1 hypothetical protein BUE76_20250 [Cnuella takakiae]SHG30458.1 3-hydroxybutyryl-CoA dehydrogenase [Cnuella takakiae]